MRRGTSQPAGEQSVREGQRAGAVDNAQSSLFRYVRSGISSGLFAGLAGLLSAGRVRRALRAGANERATKQGMMAVFWIGVAMTQWGLNRSNRHVETGEQVSTGETTSIDVTGHDRSSSANGLKQPRKPKGSRTWTTPTA